MKGGVDLQKYVDVLLPSAPATIKMVQVLFFTSQYFIIMRLYMSSRYATYWQLGITSRTDLPQGNGPIHLIGSHCVEKVVEGLDEGEEEEEESQDEFVNAA